MRDPKTEEIAPWAWRLIDKVGSYTEISPFGTGVHILGRVAGVIPHEGVKKGASELYTARRYATVTGNHLPSTPKDLEEADVSWLYELIQADVFNFPEGDKYTELFVHGAWKELGYPSKSEADLALCSLLAKRLVTLEAIDPGLWFKQLDEKEVE